MDGGQGMRGMQLPIFVDEAAEYEARGDHIVCKWKGMEFFMSVAVAYQAALRLREVLAKCHIASLDKANVVQFRSRH